MLVISSARFSRGRRRKKCSITFSVLATTIIITKCYKILQNICLYDDRNTSENACLRCVVWHDAGRRVDVYIRIFFIYKYIKWKNKYFLLIFRYIGLVHIAKKRWKTWKLFIDFFLSLFYTLLVKTKQGGVL